MQKIQVDHHALFEHVYTYAPIGIALVSLEGKWIKVNPALCNLFGYTQKELMGLTFRDITHPDDSKRDDELVRFLLDGASSLYETEKRYIQKNGNIIWASVHVSLVRDELLGTPLYFISHIVDISEKKAAEQKLLEVEELYHLITENALDMISFNTPDGITRYCSPSVRDLLGYEPEEVVGRNIFELYHPEDVEKILSHSFSDNDIFIYRVRHKNGNYIWFETTTKIIRDDKGNIQQVLGIGRNITERKIYEENLAEAQRIASLGSWEWDIANQVSSFSDEVYRIFNIDKNKCIPNDLSSFIHPDDQERYQKSIDEALKGNNFNLEFRSLQRDGSFKYLHIRVSVSFNENGVPVKMYGTVQDITERKKVELKLQETIERYTSLKKYNHDAVISLDLEGNIINTNIMAENMTGYSVKEMIGLNISKLIGADNLRRILLDSKDDDSAERNIDKITHKDGHSVEVLTTIAPIIINKQNVGFYMIAKDITEQKKLLIAMETAERTNKAKSVFLAVMSHEIRTPLNGVIGMTDLLLETTDLDDLQKEYVEIISKSGNTLLTLINDILDFSKIESGKTELLEEPFSVSDNIAETLDILMSKALEKNLEITASISPDVPDTVIGDAKRLRQVLLNLIGNAIKFTYSGGVDICVKNVVNNRNKVELQYTIKDTGIGIPEEKLGHLFQPFYQLENFMTRKSEGTGLGLAISKKLVRLMGGDIWVEHTDEPGATFVFTVCFQKENQLDAMHNERSLQLDKTAEKPLRFLIAEDNEINQLVLKKMLENLGYCASIVENGNEVMQAVAYETYDIIFMDVQMPVMNGLEATKVIKDTLPPDRCPYIIGVTANALVGDREKCLAAGMDGYISKPISNKVVVDMIEKFLIYKNTPK